MMKQILLICKEVWIEFRFHIEKMGKVIMMARNVNSDPLWASPVECCELMAMKQVTGPTSKIKTLSHLVLAKFHSNHTTIK